MARTSLVGGMELAQLGGQPSHPPPLPFPPLQQRLALHPVGQQPGQGGPESGGVVAVGQLVGDDVFEGRRGRLRQLPVDADDAVPPAGAPALPGIGQSVGCWVSLTPKISPLVRAMLGAENRRSR